MLDDKSPFPDDHGTYQVEGFREPMNEQWAAKRKMADVLRELIEAAVTTNAPFDVINGVADDLHKVLGDLRQHESVKGRSKFEKLNNTDVSVLGPELNPLDGLSNPIAEPFDIWLTEDRAYAKVTMGWAYEGPPNSVHGGFVAALFDQFLGIAQQITGQPGFTGTLSVRYMKPTPIDTELHFEGWVERIEGRKMILKAELKADGEVKASCEGLFISISKEIMERLKGGQ